MGGRKKCVFNSREWLESKNLRLCLNVTKYWDEAAQKCTQSSRCFQKSNLWFHCKWNQGKIRFFFFFFCIETQSQYLSSWLLVSVFRTISWIYSGPVQLLSEMSVHCYSHSSTYKELFVLQSLHKDGAWFDVWFIGMSQPNLVSWWFQVKGLKFAKQWHLTFFSVPQIYLKEVNKQRSFEGSKKLS